MSLKFSRQRFPEIEFPDLLLNVWCYADQRNDPICVQYQQWCVEVAKEGWSSQYLDFDYVIENLRKQSKKFYNFDKIFSADKIIIYRLIWNRQ